MQKKILLADDEPHMALMIEFLLQDYKILKATNGDEAIEKAKSEQPDLIMLDIMMPKNQQSFHHVIQDQGITVCKELKKIENTKDIPIIMLSVIANAKSKEAENAGAEKCFKKEYDDAEILKWVEKLIDEDIATQN